MVSDSQLLNLRKMRYKTKQKNEKVRNKLLKVNSINVDCEAITARITVKLVEACLLLSFMIRNAFPKK